MRYRVYFSESETKQIEEAAKGSGMSPTRFIRHLVSTHLANDQPSSPDAETTVRTDISAPETNNRIAENYSSRRFRLTPAESDRLDQLAKEHELTPVMYLRRFIRCGGIHEIYVSIEDLSQLMATYTEMTEAVMRQTKLLLRSDALPQDGALLQEQMKALEKQVLNIFDDVVKYRKQAVKKILEELKNANS